MTSYRPASEVARIATDLIAKHHEHLGDVEAEMQFVFRDKASKKGGRVVLGAARKVSGLNAWLATDQDEAYDEDAPGFFVIEIAEDEWQRLSDKQRVALVDHELSHCVIEWDDDGVPTLKIRSHDLEEFTTIVKRHGLWKEDLQWFGEAVQLTMATHA